MNKMIKGSVAGATGIVLLMGGFGTYALWSDSTSVNAGQLQSGNLDIALVDDTTNGWRDASAGRANDTWDIDKDSMVPGDVVKLTQVLDIDAVGKNLELDFSVDPIDVSSAAPAGWDNLEIGMTLDGNALESIGDGHFTAADADGEHTLVVTFSFPITTASSDYENLSLNLQSVGLNVSQHRPGDISGH
ncbi:MAG: alternate-type signal peptide domain-containing protein [Nocardioides sp.]